MEQRELKPATAGDDGGYVEAAPSLVPRRLRITGAIVAAFAVVAVLAASLLGGGSGSRSVATPNRVAAAVPNAQAARDAVPPALKSHPKVVVAVRPGEAAPVDPSSIPSTGAAAPQPPSDAEVRNE